MIAEAEIVSIINALRSHSLAVFQLRNGVSYAICKKAHEAMYFRIDARLSVEEAEKILRHIQPHTNTQSLEAINLSRFIEGMGESRIRNVRLRVGEQPDRIFLSIHELRSFLKSLKN